MQLHRLHQLKAGPEGINMQTMFVSQNGWSTYSFTVSYFKILFQAASCMRWLESSDFMLGLLNTGRKNCEVLQAACYCVRVNFSADLQARCLFLWKSLKRIWRTPPVVYLVMLSTMWAFLNNNHWCTHEGLAHQSRPVTSWVHQGRRRVFWEGPNFLKPCPIVCMSNTFSRRSKNFFRRSSPPLVTGLHGSPNYGPRFKSCLRSQFMRPAKLSYQGKKILVNDEKLIYFWKFCCFRRMWLIPKQPHYLKCPALELLYVAADVDLWEKVWRPLVYQIVHVPPWKTGLAKLHASDSLPKF